MKKTYKILIVFILIFQVAVINAQNNIKEENKIDKERDASYLSVNLLTHVNPLNPHWRFGYIQNISKKFKIGLDVGYGNHKTTIYGRLDVIDDGYQLWEIRPELYRFFHPDNKVKGYMSLELFYINHKEIFTNDYFLSENNEEEDVRINYERANYLREKYGFNIKYGFIFNLGRRLKLNVYSGLGFRIKDNTYSEVLISSRIDIHDDDDDDFDFGISDVRKEEGLNYGVNFCIGIKLLYKL